MKINEQDTPHAHENLNAVDSTTIDYHVTSGKKRKKVIAITVVCIVTAAILLGIILNDHAKEVQYKEGLLETAISVASEYGINDLAIISYRSGSVVFQSDTFENLSDENKMMVFRKFNDVTGSYSWALDCQSKGKVTILSGGIRYTAQIQEYASSYYRHLYADDSEILSETYTKPSNSSGDRTESSGGRTGSCSGGSIQCRSGFHPCHEMSNGYCNMCCRNP